MVFHCDECQGDFNGEPKQHFRRLHQPTAQLSLKTPGLFFPGTVKSVLNVDRGVEVGKKKKKKKATWLHWSYLSIDLTVKGLPVPILRKELRPCWFSHWTCQKQAWQRGSPRWWKQSWSTRRKFPGWDRGRPAAPWWWAPPAAGTCGRRVIISFLQQLNFCGY